MKNLPASPKFLFLLDYDGTLTDFKKNPDHSRLTVKALATLKKLQRKYPVVFVSGRYLDSLEKVSRMGKTPMVGTHGFESRHFPRGFKLATAAQERFFKAEAARLWKALGSLQKEFPGIHIEKKPFSSTLHYRGLSLTSTQVKSLGHRFNGVFKKSVTAGLWDLMEGKKMIEAKPKGFSKGKAVQKILKLYPGHLPIYAGDDLTDISVFRLLGKKGLKVAVGGRIPRKWSDLRFGSPEEFLDWLGFFI